MNQLTDRAGNYPITNPKVIVNKFNIFANLKTGNGTYKCVNDDNVSNLIDCNYTFIDTNDDNKTKDTNVTRSDGFYAKNIGKEINLYTSNTNNNIVIDDLTGLLWENNASAYGTYLDANNYCNNLIVDNYENWRIPNINELISITNKNTYEPATFNIFNNTTYNYPYYSSTLNAENNQSVWAINFRYGNDLVVNKNENHFVRCVHNKN